MLTRERMLDLMALVDGELEGDARDRILELVAEDPDAAAFVRDLGFLGGAVRDAAPSLAIDVAGVVMEDIARAALDEDEAVAQRGKSERVIELDPRRLQTPRRHVSRGPMVIAALALAASAFFFLRPRVDAPIAPLSPIARGVSTQVMTVTTPTPSPTDPAATQGKVAALESSEVEVEAVESPEQSVSVFYLPSGSELSSSVVVWVDEKE